MDCINGRFENQTFPKFGTLEKFLKPQIEILKKIILTGPESSGKSSLCKKLATHFSVKCVPEYARIYLEKHGSFYDYKIFQKIIKNHLQFQNSFFNKNNNDFIFLDTDLINCKVWSEMVFGKTPDFLDKKIAEENDHSYLLLYPDLPWEKDPLRENPENRLAIFERHKAEIEKLGRPYEIVKGTGNERVENGIESVENLMSKPPNPPKGG